jgi:GMP reductase
MRIIEDTKLDFKDVLFVPKRSTLKSRKEVDLYRTYKFKHSQKEYKGIPIMASNMDGVGTINMAITLSAKSLFTCLVKFYTASEIFEEYKKLDPHEQKKFAENVAISTGTGDEDFEKLNVVLTGINSLQFICIDIANGYSEHFGDYVAKVRARWPDKTIIAGNVVTADMTQELILRGADIVKVGIGPGSVCTTRVQTGVGYPQLSAIIECADAAHGLGGHIIADGGCVCPGDVSKAFGAGADFVMLGGMLAGHIEGGGTVIEEFHEISRRQPNSYAPDYEVRKFIEFYGMSSKDAQEAHGGFKDYRASEGRTVRVPFRGNVDETVSEILGGLRSTCTYVGAGTLKQLSKCTTFVRVNRQINDVFLG